MDPLIIALIVAVFTLIVLFSGIPIAFGLSFVSIALLVSFEGFQMLDVFAETFYAGLNSFVLLSIPMFILRPNKIRKNVLIYKSIISTVRASPRSTSCSRVLPMTFW